MTRDQALFAAVALGVGCAVALLIGYDARGRRWHGWFGWGTWAGLGLLFGLFVIPFYLVARIRSTKRVPGSVPGPGWYADPKHEQPFRYWDGGSWTSHTSQQRR